MSTIVATVPSLDNDFIKNLYAGRKERYIYDECLNTVMQSDEPGVPVKATFEKLAEKSTTTIVQGFKNAAKRLKCTDQIGVIARDDEVYVMVTSRVKLTAPAVTTT